jgi:hypothetical protein
MKPRVSEDEQTHERIFMFFNHDAEPEEFQDDEVEPLLKEPEPIYSHAGLDPLDELAFHVDSAMQTKAMLEEADDLAAQRPALQNRYITSLTDAGNKVSEALYMARQQEVSALPHNVNDRELGFADRLESSSGKSIESSGLC